MSTMQPLPIDNDSEGEDDISIYSDQTGIVVMYCHHPVSDRSQIDIFSQEGSRPYMLGLGNSVDREVMMILKYGQRTLLRPQRIVVETMMTGLAGFHGLLLAGPQSPHGNEV